MIIILLKKVVHSSIAILPLNQHLFEEMHVNVKYTYLLTEHKSLTLVSVSLSPKAK